MFYFLLPTGLEVALRQRAVLAYALAALLLYRLILVGFFDELRVAGNVLFPVQHWNGVALAASLQNLVTPAIHSDMTEFHQIIAVLMVLAMISFWLLFGPALEDKLGLRGLLAVFLAGGATGALLASTGVCGVGTAFWLGVPATLFALGAAYALLALENVRMTYLFWIFIYLRKGAFALPALMPLIVLHMLLVFTQADFLAAPDAPPSSAPIPNFMWLLPLPVLGALLAVGWIKVAAWFEAHAVRPKRRVA